MSAVQSADWSIHRDVQTDVSSVSEENQRPPALMHRPIGSDKQVRSQQIPVQLQRSLQIRRTRFFFSLKNALQIHSHSNFLRMQCVNGTNKRNQRRFVTP